jgi:hypothetical protein
MEKDSLIWNKILATVLKMPGVKVNRVEFLRKALADYCNEQRLSMLENVRPYTITTDKVIDMVATRCINRHTLLATTGSTIVGLPGGLAMAATIPGDLTQFYYHVVVLSQKLAYLYGFPNFCDEEGKLSDEATDLLTIFMGSMMGVKVADQGISELAKGVAKSAVGRLPRLVITKAAIYPVVMQVAKLVGTKLTKEGLAKTIGRFVPIAGGVFSGTLTLFTFRPGARRLQKRLKAQKMHFNDGDLDMLEFELIRTSFVKAEQSQDAPQARQMAMLQAMINMANISDDLNTDVQDLIEDRVARTDISPAQQIELLENLGTEFSFDVDYAVLGCDPDAARSALQGMIDVMHAAGRKTMAEKMYLNMTAKSLGVGKDELEKMLTQ